MKSFVRLLLLALPWKGTLGTTPHDPARFIAIHNESSRRVEVHWIQPQTGELFLQSNPFIYHGATFSLNSFVGHAFEVRELPSSQTGECGDDDASTNNDEDDGSGKQCRTGYFSVNANQDQVIFIRRGLRIEHTDNASIARSSAADLLSSCEKRALQVLDTSSSASSPRNAVAELVSCIETSVAAELEKSNEEIAFQARIRTKMGDLLENYTCADENLNSTEPLETRRWNDVKNGVDREVHILHNRPGSKVHYIPNFITPEECASMEEAARSLLHQATVADGAGGSRHSEARKAMQAGIKVPWQEETAGHPIAVLSRKVYDYTNHVLNLGIEEFGQEDLMSIQYFGKANVEEEKDKPPDRYMPHCDGECHGMQFKPGNRMATMVMYCTIPTRGGATNFRNAGLHIVPTQGGATFFSYIDPETKKMDMGFTEHSGCPVLEGEKKIVTQWIRWGVDEENPWDAFNTLGIKISDAAKQ